MNLPAEMVVALDGEGSVLMNMGGLAKLARSRPPKLTHIIFDHRGHLIPCQRLDHELGDHHRVVRFSSVPVTGIRLHMGLPLMQ